MKTPNVPTVAEQCCCAVPVSVSSLLTGIRGERQSNEWDRTNLIQRLPSGPGNIALTWLVADDKNTELYSLCKYLRLSCIVVSSRLLLMDNVAANRVGQVHIRVHCPPTSWRWPCWYGRLRILFGGGNTQLLSPGRWWLCSASTRTRK